MRSIILLRSLALTVLMFGASDALSANFVSVRKSSAILYDAPSSKAKKLYVVNRYMPFEQIVTLHSWVKVRDRAGKMYWVEKRALSNERYVFALPPLVDVRAGPTSSSSRVFQVRQQIALELLESTNLKWIKVRHHDGNVGYVRKAEVWGD